MPLTTIHLRLQHEQILHLADRLQALIDGRDVITHAEEIKHVVATLLAHVRMHLVAEDAGLYPRLLRSGDPAVRTMAQGFIADMGGLQKSLAVYGEQWTRHAVSHGSDEFIMTTQEVLGALRRRIAHENETLYPLAEGVQISALSTHPAAFALTAPIRHQEVSSGHALVVIVDDNQGDFILVKEAWKELEGSIHFEYFPDAACLMVWLKREPLPDLMILDVNLPKTNGPELVRILRARPGFGNVPIVLCSSMGDPHDPTRDHIPGADGFFPKPTTFSEYLHFARTMNDLIAFHRPT